MSDSTESRPVTLLYYQTHEYIDKHVSITLKTVIDAKFPCNVNMLLYLKSKNLSALKMLSKIPPQWNQSHATFILLTHNENRMLKAVPKICHNQTSLNVAPIL